MTIEVKQEAEIVHDVTLKLPPSERILQGNRGGEDRDGRAAGRQGADHHLAAVGHRMPIRRPTTRGGSRSCGSPARFSFSRISEEEGLAASPPVPADRDNVKLIVSKAATVTGRVIDTDGKPRARNRVGIWLAPIDDYSTRFGVSFLCDEQGRFTFKAAPPRSHGELSAPHDRDGRGRTTRSRHGCAV